MTTYSVLLHARKSGAIGIFSLYNTSVDAETYEQLMAKLYETYEHVMVLKVEPPIVLAPPTRLK